MAEWNQSSKGKKLPERVKEKKSMDTKQASGCGGGKKKQKKMAAVDLRKLANHQLQGYFNHLLQVDREAPLHVKCARDEKLAQLSLALHNTGDLWQSLGKVYPQHSVEQRFKLAQDITHGLSQYLKKKAMGAGCGTDMKMAPRGSSTTPYTPGMKIAGKVEKQAFFDNMNTGQLSGLGGLAGAGLGGLAGYLTSDKDEGWGRTLAGAGIGGAAGAGAGGLYGLGRDAALRAQLVKALERQMEQFARKPEQQGFGAGVGTGS